MNTRGAFVIGTRGSPLALAQAHETQRRLSEALGIETARLPLEVIKTTGDMIQDRALSEAGGKGLFTKELDVAQLEGRIDLAVHSGKDLPNDLPPGLVIAGFLPREDVRDALISRVGARFADMPAGSVVGSASLRRQAMVRRLRPDVEVALLRGNVGTRLAKIEAGECHATLLAVAGLNRLGLSAHITAVLETDEFLPAVAQGAIAIVVRERDEAARAAADAICDPETTAQVAAERAFLAVLDGSCRTPIAGHARLAEGGLDFRGLVLRPDGSQSVEGAGAAPRADAARLGAEIGRDVKARLPAGFFGEAPGGALVLRAEPEATRTAARLAALGHRPIVAPLTEIRERAEAPPPGPFDAFVATSARGARALARLPPGPPLPVFAVGARTAQAARAAGALDVRVAEGDAAALARLVAREAPPGARLLHLAGAERKAEPEASLAAAGFVVTPFVAYEAVPVGLPGAARAALAAGAVAGALHYSRRSAALFLEAAERAGLHGEALRLAHAAISEDAAEPLRSAGARHVAVAPRPDESALLSVYADAVGSAFGAECDDER